MKRGLCDTNAFTALRCENSTVLEALESADTVYLSVIVLGELYYGYIKGSRKKENMKILKRFIHKPTVEILGITRDTSLIFAENQLELKRKGTPIPTNDLWIASQCMETGAVLLTADAHFDHLPGVRKLKI